MILLLIRLYLGLRFFFIGKAQLANYDSSVALLESLGVPVPELSAWVIGGLQCVGGVFLMIGFLSRKISLLLGLAMVGAYFLAYNEELVGAMRNPRAFMSAEPFPFLFLCVVILIFGPGKVSVDTLFG